VKPFHNLSTPVLSTTFPATRRRKRRLRIIDESDVSKSIEDVASNAKPIGKHGGDRKSEQRNGDQGDYITLTRGTTGANYLTRRIARDAPDILEQMKAGEFPSVRQAAIAAGIVKVPTPLEAAMKAVKKPSAADRRKRATGFRSPPQSPA
jgi:hypothetical protein